MQLPIMVSALRCAVYFGSSLDTGTICTAGRAHRHLAEHGRAVRCVTGTVDGRTTWDTCRPLQRLLFQDVVRGLGPAAHPVGLL